MINKIIDSPFLTHTRPWWLPLLTLVITLHGILFLHWDLQPIVFLFWWEVVLMVSSALIRTLFAMEGQPFFDTLQGKIWLLILGVMMGGLFIIFSVTFTSKPFESGSSISGLESISFQKNMMTVGYAVSLVFHYFANGYFRKAKPMNEMIPFIHLWILLAFLQALTKHLIPAYPQLNQVMWTGIALVTLKFITDNFFARIRQSLYNQ